MHIDGSVRRDIRSLATRKRSQPPAARSAVAATLKTFTVLAERAVPAVDLRERVRPVLVDVERRAGHADEATGQPRRSRAVRRHARAPSPHLQVRRTTAPKSWRIRSPRDLP